MDNYVNQAVSSAGRNFARRVLLCIVLFIVFMAAAMFTALNAQTVKTDKQGNYYAVKDTSKPFERTPATPTGKTFTDTKGVKYDLYETKNGKLFYNRISKNTGKPYKVYLKLDSDKATI